MHLLCFWENVVKFWDPVVFNSYNIPSAYTLRLLNESGFKSFNISRTKWVFCKHYIFPQQQGETFAFEVSTTSPCLNSDRGLTVSPRLLSLQSHDQCGQVTQCNHKLSRKRQRDVAKTSREKVSWEFTLFLWNKFFFSKKCQGNNLWIKLWLWEYVSERACVK